MSARDSHVTNQPPNWSRPGQSFRHPDGSLPDDWRTARPADVPPRATTPDGPAASIEAWRSSPFVARELDRAERIGFAWGAGITTLCALIVLAIAGIHP